MMKNKFFGKTRSRREGLFHKLFLMGREIACSLLFPLRCPVCDDILSPEETDKGIHSKCESRLYPICGAVCMHCGRPFRKNLRINPDAGRDAYFDNSTKEFCQECTKRGYIHRPFQLGSPPKQGGYSITNAVQSPIVMGKALYLYKDAIKQTMYRLKYSNKREYALFFARQALERYPDLFFQKDKGVGRMTVAFDAIIPVPMYMPKQRKRGYNQAETFAWALSQLTGISVDTKVIQRIKDTTPQKNLDDLQRKNNLKNAFQKGESVVEYNKVLVVDDIYTTGSTVEAVAEELRHIGIRQVYVLSICIGGEM